MWTKLLQLRCQPLRKEVRTILPVLLPEPLQAGRSEQTRATTASRGRMRLNSRAVSKVAEEEIKMIQDRFNNKPCKRLAFKTPLDGFQKSPNRVALRT